MASYFNSNHTTNRFLANNQTSGSQNSQPTTSQQTQNQNRSRLPSSKHFSTSVNTSAAGDRSRSTKDSQSPSVSTALGSETPATVHPLRNTWVFWFRQQRAPGNKNVNYEEGIKKISAFSSVESFWSLWTHLAPPSALQPTTDYLLFHTGVRRPIWEDPINLPGGKWIIRLRKGIADRLWEDLVLAIIGDQFDQCKTPPQPGIGGNGSANPNSNGNGGSLSADEDTTDWPEICGCTISVRQNEDIVSLWNRYEVDYKVREKIRDTLKRVLNLPATTTMEYKTNNDSMQDRSSFRTTNLHERTPHP